VATTETRGCRESIPEFPPQHGEDQQESDSDEQAQWAVSSVVDDKSPRRTGDAGSPSNGNDHEHDRDQIANER
jgi:hypothetical protein